MTAPVAVLGGGIAGLTAAWTLRRRGIPVIVYEAGRQIAGLAASFHDDDGFTYDFGAHFITNRLAAAVGVGAQCRDVLHYGEQVHLEGRTHSYPFGLMASPGFALSALTARFGGDGREGRTAAEVFRARYGHRLTEKVAAPLLEAWSGTPVDQLSAAAAGKFQNSILRTLWLKSASALTGRAVCCGYSHDQPEHAWIWHVYPMGGIALICQRLMEGLEGAMRMETRIEEIQVEDGRVVAIRANGREQAVSAVVSTAPVNILSRLVKGTEVLSPLARFRYRPMVFVNLRFRGRGLLKDTVIWTPEPRFPFFRLTETTLSMPWLAPHGHSLICADIGCTVGDRIWSMADEDLGLLCLEHMSPLIGEARARYQGCRVLRTPIAYPIYHLDYEEDRAAWARSTGVQGLYSVGRNGEFAHILMEDIYWRTQRKMRALATECGTVGGEGALRAGQPHAMQAALLPR